MAYIQKEISKKAVNNIVQILILICLSRNFRIRYKTQIYINKELWSDKTKDLKTLNVSSKLSPELLKQHREAKEALDDIANKVEFFKREFPELAQTKIVPANSSDSKEVYLINYFLDATTNTKCSNLTHKKVESIIKGNSGSTAFMDLMSECIAKRDCREDTKQHYWSIVRSMMRYELFCCKMGKKFHWDVDKVTSDDIDSFMEYLLDENVYQKEYPEIFNEILKDYPIEISHKHKNAKIRERHKNYLACVQKKMKAFWNYERKMGVTQNNPFFGAKIYHESYGDPYYLNLEERHIIEDYDFSHNPAKETQRDIFIFQSLTGCRVGDLLKLTPDNIVQGILTYTPSKSSRRPMPRTVQVPLNEKALSILKKYEGLDPKGRILPFLSRDKYNKYIKQILKDCGITRNVQVKEEDNFVMRPIDVKATSHMARRTFIGISYKKTKDIGLINEMTDHAEWSKATSRYFKRDTDDYREVINKIL